MRIALDFMGNAQSFLQALMGEKLRHASPIFAVSPDNFINPRVTYRKSQT